MVIARALELFIEDVTLASAKLAQRNNDSKVTPSHIKEVISGQGAGVHLGFLREAVAKIPDLVREDQSVAVVEEQEEEQRSVASLSDQDGK